MDSNQWQYRRLDEEYPATAQKAKTEHADIYWGDETGVRNDYQHAEVTL